MILSAIIPAWNRARLVCDAIDSALAQRPGDVEVIVVDDASTDGTVDMLARRYGSAIRLLQLPRRGGPGAARNAGIAVATGEVVSFLDSDDLWLPGKLDAELRAMSRLEADAVITDSIDYLEGEPEGQTRFERNGLFEACAGQTCRMNDLRWLWTNSANGVATSSLTVRRDALARLGTTTFFAEDLDSCEDWEFEMRLYHHLNVAVLPEVRTSIRRFVDGSRVGRAAPGTPRTPEQDFGLLRDRLKVVRRSQWLTGLEAHLAAELERFGNDTARQLAEYGQHEEGR